MYRLTIRICSDDTIRPNTNTLFRALFGTEANIQYIPTENGVICHLEIPTQSSNGCGSAPIYLLLGKHAGVCFLQ